VRVEQVPGDRLVRTGAAAGPVGSLQHDDAATGAGEVAGGDEAVVTAADDVDGWRGHGTILWHGGRA
jgi:hypothetical protein